MKILFVAHTFPYPLHEGIRLHTYHLLKNLSRQHDIDLISFIESEDERTHLSSIDAFCRSITTIVHRVPKQGWKRLFNTLFQTDPYIVHQFTDQSMTQAILRALRDRRPDVFHIDFLVMAQYGRLAPDVPKVFFCHDAMSLLFERNIAHERNPAFRWYTAGQTRKIALYETKILTEFERTVVVSPVDRDVLQKRCPTAMIETNPNGVDIEYFQPRRSMEKLNVILFRGIMSFLPNFDAALFFAREVMPLIWKEMPQAQFWIVGWNAPSELMTLMRREPRVCVTGFVPDIRAPTAEATVVVCPMRIGSGIKNKILESMAMSKAIVATSMSLAGIDVRPNVHLLVADDKTALAHETLRLMRSAELRVQLGEAARKWVQEHHSWVHHADRFTQIYEEAIIASKQHAQRSY